MEKEIRSFEVRIAPTDTEERRIEGYAAVFDSWSQDLGGFREIIRKGAFEKAIETCDVRCLYNHNPDHLLGRNKAGTLELREDDKGLWFSCLLPKHSAKADEVYEALQRGDVNQCSFGFMVNDKGEKWTPAQKRGEPDERELTDLSLFDVSVVVYPAYEATSAQARCAKEARDEHERFVKEQIQRNKNKLKLMEVICNV